MFADVAMEHPFSWIIHGYEQFVGLAARNSDGVFPLRIGVWCTILAYYGETLAMDMNWVLHGVHGVAVVVDRNAYHITPLELPLHGAIHFAGVLVGDLPFGIS